MVEENVYIKLFVRIVAFAQGSLSCVFHILVYK